MKDLKQRAIRGGLAKISSQAANFALRTGALMVFARILSPRDFGLVGMVTAVIGVFGVFRDFGLSAAAVQRVNVSDDQSSTLFWINLLIGFILSALGVMLAPLVAVFYHEPHLVGITAVLASAFLLNSAGVQHASMLERQMRFTTLSMFDICSLLASTTVGLILAKAGFGYWALVATATVTPLVYTCCVWGTTRWVPSRPRKDIEVLAMLRFGGTLTANGLLTYLTSNLDKVLLGRFLGAIPLGIYGRAYQLLNIPTDNLNASVGGVVFATLSRVQDEPERVRSYFLKGYSLVLSMTMPITLLCAACAPDVILVVLGRKWTGAIPIFRLLAPTIIGYSMLTPFTWFLAALGKVGRGLRMAFVLTPVLVLGYIIGIWHGPVGLAIGYSSAMAISVLPLIAWATKETPVSFGDLLCVVRRPMLAGLVAAAAAFGVQYTYMSTFSHLLRLAIDVLVFGSVYLPILLFEKGQRSLYREMFQGLSASQG